VVTFDQHPVRQGYELFFVHKPRAAARRPQGRGDHRAETDTRREERTRSMTCCAGRSAVSSRRTTRRW
jgi:hypothetical protein